MVAMHITKAPYANKEKSNDIADHTSRANNEDQSHQLKEELQQEYDVEQ